MRARTAPAENRFKLNKSKVGLTWKGATVGAGDGLLALGVLGHLTWSAGLDTAKGSASVTAFGGFGLKLIMSVIYLGSKSTYRFANVLVDQLSAGGLDNLSSVGRSIVRQGASVGEPLNHCWIKWWKLDFFGPDNFLHKWNVFSLGNNSCDFSAIFLWYFTGQKWVILNKSIFFLSEHNSPLC